MRYTETIEWLICDVCNQYVPPSSPAAIGWLKVDTMALGIVANTSKERHLCVVCRKDFDDFWGE